MSGPNQHFVPQYYLKNFAKDGNIFVFDKDQNRYLSKDSISVQKVGFAKNFYSIDPSDLSRFLLEGTDDWDYIDSLIEVYNERISAPLINSFINVGEFAYQNPETEIISVVRTEDILDFFMVQLFRTPFFRVQFELIARDIHKKNRHLPDLIRRKPIEKLASTIHGVYIVSALCNTNIWKNTEKEHLIKPEYRFIDTEVVSKFEQLRNMNKTLWISSLESQFITSDNPIYVKQSPQGMIQMASFPITRRCAINFSEFEIADNSVVVINEKRKNLLEAQNLTMKRWANRFIYS